MESFLEIRSFVPPDSGSSELELWILFFCWIVAIIAIIYGWSVEFDPEVWIRHAANTVTGVAAALPIAAVRIDTAARAKFPPANPPASAARAEYTALRPLAQPAAATPTSPPSQTKPWCWEQPGWAGRPGRFSTREEPQLPDTTDYAMLKSALDQPTQVEQRALRQKERDEAAKKVVDEFWTGFAVETPLPLPQPPKRAFLSPPPGYQICYEKFRSIFRADECSHRSSGHECLPGHLQANIREFLPTPPQIDLTQWTGPDTVDPSPPQPRNGSMIGDLAKLMENLNTQSSTDKPAGPPNVASPSGNLRPRSQSDRQAAQSGSVPMRAPTSDTPAAGPSNLAPTNPVVGGATPAPTQPSNGASVFGDGTAPTSTNNPLFHMTVEHARSEIDRNMDQIYKTIEKVGKSVAKSGGKTAWRVNTNNTTAKTKIAGYVKSLNNICDWVQGPDGRVDESKLPRSSWSSFGLDAQSLTQLNQALQKGYEYEPDNLNNFWKAANRIEKLFK